MLVEIILNDDSVFRHIFKPHMVESEANLIWKNVFQFQEKHDRAESVVWSKYASTCNDVHRLGCEKEYADRQRRSDNLSTYIGAIQADVIDIRDLRSATGCEFNVVHEPSEGIHHAHIVFHKNDGNISKNDRSELKFQLKAVFSDTKTHACV